LDVLKRVHFGMNNFYNEYTHAKSLHETLPVSGTIPKAARNSWVKVIGLCYIGNGHGYREGVDESALSYYETFVDSFSEAEIIEFLKLLEDAEFTSALSITKPDERIRNLAHQLYKKVSNVHIKNALNLLIEAPPRKIDLLFQSTQFKDAVKHIPDFNV